MDKVNWKNIIILVSMVLLGFFIGVAGTLIIVYK